MRQLQERFAVRYRIFRRIEMADQERGSTDVIGRAVRRPPVRTCRPTRLCCRAPWSLLQKRFHLRWIYRISYGLYFYSLFASPAHLGEIQAAEQPFELSINALEICCDVGYL
jgi:hypothetical protein